MSFLDSFSDFCDRKRMESKQRYINEGQGFGSMILRGMNANEQRQELRMRVYQLMTAIRASNYAAAKETHRNKNLLVGIWAEDMRTAEEMESVLKGAFNIEGFLREYGTTLSEMEADYASFLL